MRSMDVAVPFIWTALDGSIQRPHPTLCCEADMEFLRDAIHRIAIADHFLCRAESLHQRVAKYHWHIRGQAQAAVEVNLWFQRIDEGDVVIHGIALPHIHMDRIAASGVHCQEEVHRSFSLRGIGPCLDAQDLVRCRVEEFVDRLVHLMTSLYATIPLKNTSTYSFIRSTIRSPISRASNLRRVSEGTLALPVVDAAGLSETLRRFGKSVLERKRTRKTALLVIFWWHACGVQNDATRTQ